MILHRRAIRQLEPPSQSKGAKQRGACPLHNFFTTSRVPTVSSTINADQLTSGKKRETLRNPSPHSIYSESKRHTKHEWKTTRVRFLTHTPPRTAATNSRSSLRFRLRTNSTTSSNDNNRSLSTASRVNAAVAEAVIATNHTAITMLTAAATTVMTCVAAAAGARIAPSRRLRCAGSSSGHKSLT